MTTMQDCQDYNVSITVGPHNRVALTPPGKYILCKGNSITLTPPTGVTVTEITIYEDEAKQLPLGSWDGRGKVDLYNENGTRKIYTISGSGTQAVITDDEEIPPGQPDEEYWFGGELLVQGQTVIFDPEMINKRGG